MRTGLALGSNLGDRLAHLRAARTALAALPGVAGPLLSSRLYETDPVGTGPDAGPFLNAVVELTWPGPPSELLDLLQTLEAAHGRPSKRPRNAPRTLDLDILYVGNLTLTNQELIIPHPRLHIRRFVLAPLADLRPELILPGQHAPIAALLAALPDPGGVRLRAETW